MELKLVFFLICLYRAYSDVNVSFFYLIAVKDIWECKGDHLTLHYIVQVHYCCDTPHNRNPGVSTIEDELLQALAKADAIPYYLKSCPRKLQFQLCSRTDKGVSAARQAVSLMISC